MRFGAGFISDHAPHRSLKSHHDGCREWYILGHDEAQRSLIQLVVVLAHGHFIGLTVSLWGLGSPELYRDTGPGTPTRRSLFNLKFPSASAQAAELVVDRIRGLD